MIDYPMRRKDDGSSEDATIRGWRSFRRRGAPETAGEAVAAVVVVVVGAVVDVVIVVAVAARYDALDAPPDFRGARNRRAVGGDDGVGFPNAVAGIPDAVVV